MSVVLMLAAILLMASPASAAPPNTMSIADKSGTSSASYPLQFGRAFVAGEIANYPQALINGAAVPTQADIKNRHPDGSVKFAVLAVVVPTIPANGTVALSFQNQTSGNNTPLTSAQMLDPKYADPTIGLDGTTVSARAMLSAGKCVPWTQGPIAQTMLCADDSLAHAYDVGPIRPRFRLTFWSGLGRVAVRYVVENSLAGAMIDKQYAVSLTLGGAEIYDNPELVHPFGSRWTRVVWQGAKPQPKINIDPNLPYLASTRYVPSMDTSTVVPEATIASDYTAWQAAPKGLYERGFWTKYMPTTGGRDDLGLMPGWYAKWLYTGDWRLREIVLGLADLAAAWPLHFREGRAGKKIDRAQSVDGVGLPLSVYAEPGAWLPNNNGIYGQGITATESHTIVTDPTAYPSTAHGWEAEGAHLPSPFYVPYVLTGDPFYLEESQLWSAQLAFSMPGVPYTSRGPGAGIENQTRGNAWLLADRFNSYVATPDDQPTMRKFLSDIMGDALAQFEGKAGITGTPYQGTPEWVHGQAKSLGTDPLHFEGFQDIPPQSSQWQHYYLINALGWATERGLPTKSYRDWVGRMLTGQFAEPSYNRFNVSSYWIAVKDAAGAWYPTWAALQTENIALGRMTTGTLELGNYGYWARAAATFMVDLPDGQTAYDWLRANLVIDPVIAGLQWNLVPSGAVAPPIPPLPPTGIQVGSSVKTLAVVSVRKAWDGKVLCIQPGGAAGVVASGPTGNAPSWSVNFTFLCDGYVPAAALEVLP